MLSCLSCWMYELCVNSVHTGGMDAPTQVSSTRLAQTTATSSSIPFGDGHWHTARIVYYRSIVLSHLTSNRFGGSDRLKSYIHDNPGTFCVFIDDLITPLLCIPLSLTSTINLDSGRANVGFTAATGKFFQTHEILKWTFCGDANAVACK
jgi:hypothetical protein